MLLGEKHPGESVPLKEVVSDSVAEADPLFDSYVHSANEPEDATTTPKRATTTGASA